MIGTWTCALVVMFTKPEEASAAANGFLLSASLNFAARVQRFLCCSG